MPGKPKAAEFAGPLPENLTTIKERNHLQTIKKPDVSAASIGSVVCPIA